jgi:hypothetical protein
MTGILSVFVKKKKGKLVNAIFFLFVRLCIKLNLSLELPLSIILFSMKTGLIKILSEVDKKLVFLSILMRNGDLRQERTVYHPNQMLISVPGLEAVPTESTI